MDSLGLPASFDINQSLSTLNSGKGENLARSMKAAASAKNETALDEAAQQFEAVFLTQMLQSMFSGIDVDPMFGGGSGEKVWRSMQIDEYSKILSQSGSVGIADALKSELIALQSTGGAQ